MWWHSSDSGWWSDCLDEVDGDGFSGDLSMITISWDDGWWQSDDSGGVSGILTNSNKECWPKKL